MRIVNSVLILLLLTSATALAQDVLNGYDEGGNRHGVWKKYYEGSKQLRYQGTFEHGKEVGTFTFYCEDCKDQPALIKVFDQNSTKATLTYFEKNGKKSSEGVMDGRERIGEWLYYHKDGSTVMTRESYTEGVLDGQKITYYPDGTKTEVLTYKSGIPQGANLYYSPAGVLIKELNNENGELHGAAKYYGPTGDLVIKGQYKRGAKDGLWQYFKNGKITKEETFPKRY